MPQLSEEPTDTDLLNALERHALNEPLVLWDGDGDFPGTARAVGLAFGTHRTFRKAIRQMMGFNA